MVRATDSDCLLLERLEPRLEPLSTVPFPRNLDDVRRDDLLDHIHGKASALESIIVLVGLSGVGLGQYRLRALCSS